MKIVAYLRNTLLAGAAGAALCLAPVAQGGTLVTTGWAVGSPLSFNVVSPVTGTPLGVGTTNVSAGAFSGTFESVPIVFWCIQLDQFFSLGGTYNNYTMTLENSGYFVNLGKLFNEAYASALLNATNAAAFQLAIWNIVYDTDSTVATGAFRATSGDLTARNQANTWLAGLGSFSDNFDTFSLTNPDNQDFVLGTKTGKFVPEPTPLLLIGAALVALMVARRRGGQAHA